MSTIQSWARARTSLRSGDTDASTPTGNLPRVGLGIGVYSATARTSFVFFNRESNGVLDRWSLGRERGVSETCCSRCVEETKPSKRVEVSFASEDLSSRFRVPSTTSCTPPPSSTPFAIAISSHKASKNELPFPGSAASIMGGRTALPWNWACCWKSAALRQARQRGNRGLFRQLVPQHVLVFMTCLQHKIIRILRITYLQHTNIIRKLPERRVAHSRFTAI